MKITLTFKEIEQLKNIMESIEKDSSKELIGSLKNNKLITCNVDLFNQKTTINVSEEYTVDFLAVYGKYVKILACQVKGIIDTVKTFSQETDKVVEKYAGEKKGSVTNARH